MAGDFTDYWGTQSDPDGVVRMRTSDTEHSLFLDNVTDELAYFEQLPVGRILDFGCGPGWFLEALSEWAKFGVEIAPQALSVLKALGIPHATNLDEQASCSFDAVFCYHVIEHLPDPLDALDQIRRVLQAGWAPGDRHAGLRQPLCPAVRRELSDAVGRYPLLAIHLRVDAPVPAGQRL